MPIVAKSGGGEFTPAPGGVWSAVCVDVVDLGMVPNNFGPDKKPQHKIRIVWQIDERMEDGKRFVVAQRYTLSLHEKATLRSDLESWRGRQFTPDEEAGFDVETVIGVPCMLNVVQEQKGADIFANIKAVMPLPRGMPPITLDADYIRVCHRQPTEPQQGQRSSNAPTNSGRQAPQGPQTQGAYNRQAPGPRVVSRPDDEKLRHLLTLDTDDTISDLYNNLRAIYDEEGNGHSTPRTTAVWNKLAPASATDQQIIRALYWKIQEEVPTGAPAVA